MEWAVVYQSVDIFKVEMAKLVLSEHNIKSVIYNKQDTMYQMLNSIIPVKLLVFPSDLLSARNVLKNNLT